MALEDDCIRRGSPEKQNSEDIERERKRFTIRNWLMIMVRRPRSAVGKLEMWQASGAV